MKVSDLTVEAVKEYCRVSSDDENMTLDAILTSAKQYIKSYTGLSDDEIDTHEDLTIAAFALCSDMYDNRQMSVQNGNDNQIVTTILSMHSKNYL